ncbi:hypothetical protein, partial [Leptospira wolffii]|uniref:hypothetical protein n=1 Tax=Leptospira wolffii TaxID=409998 RepID=UPI00143845B8
VSGNIIALWEHEESSKRTIRGRAVAMGANLVAKGSGEFFVSTTNYGNQTGPKIAVKDTTGFVVWWATDSTQQNIRGYTLDMLNPGALQYGLNNFFVAPLIERDYTLKAQINF